MDDQIDREVTLQEMRNTLYRNAKVAVEEYNDFLNTHWAEFRGEPRLCFDEYFVNINGVRIAKTQ